jgi:hypothetical protein
MIRDHLERAAIEIHYALADLSTRGAAALSPASEEDERVLMAALRFALFELEWVRLRLDGGEAADRYHGAAQAGAVSPDPPC